MAGPRWSELAEELGIDWPRSDSARPLPPLPSRSRRSKGQDPDAPFDQVGSGSGEQVGEAPLTRAKAPAPEPDGAVDLEPEDAGRTEHAADEPGPIEDAPAASTGALAVADAPARRDDTRDLDWRLSSRLSTQAGGDDDRFGELGLHLAGVLRAAHEAMGDLHHLEDRLAELRSVHASIGKALEEAQEQLRASLDALDPRG